MIRSLCWLYSHVFEPIDSLFTCFVKFIVAPLLAIFIVAVYYFLFAPLAIVSTLLGGGDSRVSLSDCCLDILSKSITILAAHAVQRVPSTGVEDVRFVRALMATFAIHFVYMIPFFVRHGFQ